MQKILLPSMLALVCMAGAFVNPGFAQHTVFVTPDVTTDDPGGGATVYRPWDVLAYNNPDYEPVPVVSFPANTIIDALHKMDAVDSWLISVDIATELPPASGDVFQAEDVIHYDGSDYTMFFDGSANGVPPGVDVDAMFLIGGDSGDLVISFDKVTTIDSTTYESSDLVRFSGGTFSVYFDASSSGSGVPRSSNLTGASDDTGGAVLAFGTASDLAPSTGPVTYTRGNLAQWDGVNYGLFDSLAGWPGSSRINAMFCCPDGDADIVCTAVDNCPATPNRNQENADGDAAGDICDLCADDPFNDTDSDSICGELDNCPDHQNPPSDCDSNGGTPDEQCDADTDGRGDACDNCQEIPNPGQFDTDSDGIGNACETDVDGDGTPDTEDPDDDNDGIPEDDGDGSSDPCPDGVTIDCDDNCPTVQNSNQRDWDSDGVGDECDLDDGMVNGGVGSQGTSPTRTKDGGSTIFRYDWIPETGALSYNMYRVLLSELSATNYGVCYRNGILTRYTEIGEDPPVGDGYGYLVTVELSGGEGTLGNDSGGNERLNISPCP